MTVIIDIRIPANQFALGQLLDEFPDINIELERLVPLREGIIPLFWVEGADPDDIIRAIRADPLTQETKLLTDVDNRYLFEVRWSPEINTLIRPIIQTGAEVLRAEGTVEKWEFRLQFKDRDELGEFRDQCRTNDVQMDLKALYNPSLPEVELKGGLTDQQYDILTTAHELGFFDIPRGVTTGELADLIGISSNAASQRMRRGLNTVVGQAIAPGGPFHD